MVKKSFRSLAAFGKRIEYWIVGRMLKEGLDVYLPLVDDDAVDALVRRPDGSAALVQIKARSRDVIPGDAALFAAIDHPTERDDYWFVFYSERMDVMWIMTSREFINGSHQNKKGKNAGKRTAGSTGGVATRSLASALSTPSRSSRRTLRLVFGVFGMEYGPSSTTSSGAASASAD